MIENIQVLAHACIKIDCDKIIYFDPYLVKENYNDADIIFITHDHYDHYSEEDILKLKNDNTVIVITKDLEEKALNIGFNKENIVIVEPNNKYKIDTIKFETVNSYNTNKNFHPKENGWVGYIVKINGKKVYVAGDTDITDENKKVKCDIACVPIGGTYTMDYKEAAELVNIINPEIAIPIHYGSIVGTKEDAIEFSNLVHDETESVIYDL